jgi:hypothetical protein
MHAVERFPMNSRSCRRSLLFAGLALSTAYVVCEQQFWKKKDYRHWSKTSAKSS